MRELILHHNISIIQVLTLSLKTSHLWLAVTVNGFWCFFGRNVTDKVGKQKTLYHATSINLCFCNLHYPVKWRNAKIVFFPQCCISALPEFNHLLDFFNLFDSRLILMLLYDSISIVINAFSYREYWRHGLGERKSIAPQQLDCFACTMHQCAVFWVSYFAR